MIKTLWPRPLWEEVLNNDVHQEVPAAYRLWRQWWKDGRETDGKAIWSQRLIIKMSERITSFNCYFLGSSREYVVELVKHHDLIALQETWLFPWDLAVPSTLGVEVNSFSLSSIYVTNGIMAGITFIWHWDFGCNIQAKRFESDRILGLSVTITGSSILFINVYFPLACHEKHKEYIMCLGIISSILESNEEDHVCILENFI